MKSQALTAPRPASASAAPASPLRIPRPSTSSPDTGAARAVAVRLVCLPTTDLVPLRPAPPPLPTTPPPLARRPSSSAPPKSGPASGTTLRVQRQTEIRYANDDTLLETLFDALRDLDQEPDALSAARMCLDALARVMPSRMFVMHAFDVAKREFLAVDVHGDEADAVVLAQSSADDPLLRIAMTHDVPFPWNDLRKAPVRKLARFSEVAPITRVLVCPVSFGRRWLGALEIVDPTDGAPFTTENILGARYVAERYARFVVTHGIVLDVGLVARFAARCMARG